MTAFDRLAERANSILANGGETLAAGLLALAVLIAGLLLARVLAWLTQTILGWVRFDAGVRSISVDGRFTIAPTHFAAWIVRWAVILFAALFAADLLGFDLSSAVSDRLAQLLPRVTVAAIVLVAGLLMSLAFAWTVRRLFESGGFAAGVVASRVVAGVLGTFAVLLALEQLGLAAQVLTALAITVVASVGLGAALAFGLGCRDVARDFLVELLRSFQDDSPRSR